MSKYEYAGELDGLIEAGMVTKRGHQSLPLDIYNYTQAAQFTPIAQWTPAMYDCRGLILDREHNIVGRPFRKFWNYEQVLDQIPAAERFNVWEKMDGSLGIVCKYQGNLVVATRGSFDSEQAKRLGVMMVTRYHSFDPGEFTYLFEIIYPENRIVVDYGDTRDVFLLAVHDKGGRDQWDVFRDCRLFPKARRFDGISDFGDIEAMYGRSGMEGFVVQWERGFRAKVKLAEYKRLHQIVTQCSTRSIWNMLRAGDNMTELTDRVPPEFEKWARRQIEALSVEHFGIVTDAQATFEDRPHCEARKDFALWALQFPDIKHLLFRLYDCRDITDDVWKMVEPKWEKAFATSEE